MAFQNAQHLIRVSQIGLQPDQILQEEKPILPTLQNPPTNANTSMQCAGLQIHFFDPEISPTDMCFPLNPILVQEIAKRGWIIREKVGEGTIADVFSVTSTRYASIRAVVVLSANYVGALDISEKLQFARQFPVIFPTIYDEFTLDTPYTTNPIAALDNADFGRRTIQIIQTVIPLDKYLDEAQKEYPQQMPQIVEYVRDTLETYLYVLDLNGATFFDLNPFNMGVVSSRTGMQTLKLIDIDTLRFDEKFADLGETPHSLAETFFEKHLKKYIE